jgi:hypothetical protein
MRRTATESGCQAAARSMRLRAAAAALLVLAASPCWAGPPFVTDDPEPADLDHFEINLAAIVNFMSTGKQGSLPFADINYGAAEDLQLHLGLQNAFDEQAGRPMRDGYGDTELGVKYRFIEEDEEGWQPQVAIYPNVEIPTGSVTKQFGTGKVRAFLPVWVQKSFGDWTTFGGGGYWLNPTNGITPEKSYWFGGWALLRRFDENWNLGGELFWQSPNGEETLTGAGFNLGGEYDIDDGHHILFSAGRGLEDPTRFNAFSFYLGLQLII